MDAAGRLGFVAQLAFYRLYARFPRHRNEFAPSVLLHLARQIGMEAVLLRGYEWDGRTGRRHRETILAKLQVRPFDKTTEPGLRAWLVNEVLPKEPSDDALDEWLTAWSLKTKVQRPSPYHAERLLKGARAAYESNVAKAVLNGLEVDVRARLKGLLVEDAEGRTPLAKLREDPGRVGLDSILDEIDKLNVLRSIGIPSGILRGVHHDLLKRFRRRASAECMWELRRHDDDVLLPLLVFYCVPREAELADGVVELLLQITQRMSTRAERRVNVELLDEIRRVRGKEGILYRIAEAASEQPDGTVRDVIYPIASEETLADLVREYKATGGAFKRRVHKLLRSSYGSRYRRMLPKLLAALRFSSNNETHRPLLDAIEILKARGDDNQQYYRLTDIPVEVIKPKWRDVVIEASPAGEKRINRISYEICVLESLRDQVRCKEVWVQGARRFRNPDEDLPGDFKKRRDECYEALKLPQSADVFIDKLKSDLAAALSRFNDRIPHNPHVRLNPQRKKKPIVLSKVEPQPEPRNLSALKLELGHRWPMTSLLDMLKEADLRIGFTEVFSTAASREAVNRGEVQRRLLLCLYGLGSNAGLKRLGVGNNVSYKELLNTRRLYLDKESLRDATRRVVNATLGARRTEIWGEGTSACASDSKKFAAYDQNLMTEWHVRYGGRGVMVYWHVERKSVCIYSQLKRCSSSEVASMIEGVLHHETDMDVERQYTDTHGQTVVGFAFCHLLGFSLRIPPKAITFSGRSRLTIPLRIRSRIPVMSIIAGA